MNRHERRSAVRSVRHTDLLTYLVDTSVPLSDHVTLRNAVLHWYAHIADRKPICIACKARFFGDNAKVGAFLLSTPVSVPDIVATSAFCTSCHETLSVSEVDAICTRVLRALSPHGKFLDAR